MKKTFMFIAAALVVMAACNKQEASQPSKVLSLSAAVEQHIDVTKTALDGTHVVWNPGDAIKVFDNTGKAAKLSTTADGTTTADFTEDSHEDGFSKENTPLYAIYPYAAGTTASGSTITFSMPATQTYVAGSFDPACNVMVGEVSGTNVSFKNVFGLLKLQLKGVYKVSRIELRGKNNEKLNGTFTVDASLAEPAVSTVTTGKVAEKTITLNCGEGVQLSPSTATSFYFVVPVGAFGTLGNGFDAKVYDVNGDAFYATLSTTASGNVINRSKVRAMPVCNASFLPDRFLDVEGVKVGTGASGINTLLKPTQVHTVSIKYMVESFPASNAGLYGVWATSEDSDALYMLSIGVGGYCEIGYPGHYTGFVTGVPENTPAVISSTMYNGVQAVSIDGDLKFERSLTGDPSATYNIALLGRMTSSGINYSLWNTWMYYCMMYDTTDKLCSYMIPCLDSSAENLPGMYDVVRKGFYPQVGTLFAGPNLTK